MDSVWKDADRCYKAVDKSRIATRFCEKQTFSRVGLWSLRSRSPDPKHHCPALHLGRYAVERTLNGPAPDTVVECKCPN